MSVLCIIVFFFKQKTAYDMRISDWSSDVCSSDLLDHAVADVDALRKAVAAENQRGAVDRGDARPVGAFDEIERTGDGRAFGDILVRLRRRGRDIVDDPDVEARISDGAVARSEEHTSELQSLMRISYAVFCLKKKKNT